LAYNLETYQLITQIAKLQGVQLIDIYNSSKKENEKNNIFRSNNFNDNNNENNKIIIKIAVAIKRKLIILQWNQDSFEKLNVFIE